MIQRKFVLSLALALAAPLALAAADKNADGKSLTAKTSAGQAAGAGKVAAAPAPNLPALSAAQIIERNAKARGGADLWQRVNSMTVAGVLDAGKVRRDGGTVAATSGMGALQAKAERRANARKAMLEKPEDAQGKIIQLPYQMELKRPMKSRVEIQFQGQTAVQVFDGANGYKVRPYLGRKEAEAFTADEQRMASEQQELDGPLLNYQAKGTKVALDGTEMINGKPAYRLQLTLKDGAQRRIWIDGKTFLEARLEGAPRHFDGKMRPVMTTFKDYRAVEGLMIPYLLETTVDGVTGSERIVVQKVALNPALADARFARPI